VDINRAWETISENIKILAKETLGYYELKKHKPWFGRRHLKLLNQWKHAQLQWVQNPSEINWDNLNNIRREASRHFRNKKREYLRDKINELATNSKNKNTIETCI
jgi:5-methylcytosine-specific restriction endonuclease McrBC GTP-binding regulatory subunit McrB